MPGAAPRTSRVHGVLPHRRRCGGWWLVVAGTLIACSERAVPQGAQCQAFSRLQGRLDRGGMTQLTAELDCDGLTDTITIRRTADGKDAGLPQIVVNLGDSRLHLSLETDGLPRILDAGDLDGDGVMDLLLGNADESVTIWPTIVLVKPDTLHVVEGLVQMGVYQYDPVLDPDCDYRDLLPKLELGPEGRLLVSWIQTATTIHGPARNCRAPARASWEVHDGQIRLRE